MITIVNIMQLRDYQNLAISNVRKSYKARHRSVLLTLPTGAGKTVIFSEITKLAKLKNKTTKTQISDRHCWDI